MQISLYIHAVFVFHSPDSVILIDAISKLLRLAHFSSWACWLECYLVANLRRQVFLWHCWNKKSPQPLKTQTGLVSLCSTSKAWCYGVIMLARQWTSTALIWWGPFESHLVANPKDRFLVMWLIWLQQVLSWCGWNYITVLVILLYYNQEYMLTNCRLLQWHLKSLVFIVTGNLL